MEIAWGSCCFCGHPHLREVVAAVLLPLRIRTRVLVHLGLQQQVALGAQRRNSRALWFGGGGRRLVVERAGGESSETLSARIAARAVAV